MKHLITLADHSVHDISRWIELAHQFKRQTLQPRRSHPFRSACHGRTLALLFNKRSTRTRVAAESGFHLLGGHPLFLSSADIQFGVNEGVEDTSRTLGVLADMLFVRSHSSLDQLRQMALWSGLPLVNALSADFHPSQALASLQTLHEVFCLSQGSTDLNLNPDTLKGLQVAWVGDWTNVLNSLLLTLPRYGICMHVATPPQYRAPAPVWNFIQQSLQSFSSAMNASHSGSAKTNFADNIRVFDRPEEALKGAHVVVTDTWTSMGQDIEHDRLRVFQSQGYHITHDLCDRSGADPSWRFMHCLPRKMGQEVSEEVFADERRSLVFQEAANRRYTLMAVFDQLMELHLQEMEGGVGGVK